MQEFKNGRTWRTTQTDDTPARSRSCPNRSATIKTLRVLEMLVKEEEAVEATSTDYQQIEGMLIDCDDSPESPKTFYLWR